MELKKWQLVLGLAIMLIAFGIDIGVNMATIKNNTKSIEKIDAFLEEIAETVYRVDERTSIKK